jgi:hypothetical protein
MTTESIKIHSLFVSGLVILTGVAITATFTGPAAAGNAAGISQGIEYNSTSISGIDGVSKLSTVSGETGAGNQEGTVELVFNESTKDTPAVGDLAVYIDGRLVDPAEARSSPGTEQDIGPNSDTPVDIDINQFAGNTNDITFTLRDDTNGAPFDLTPNRNLTVKLYNLGPSDGISRTKRVTLTSSTIDTTQDDDDPTDNSGAGLPIHNVYEGEVLAFPIDQPSSSGPSYTVTDFSGSVSKSSSFIGHSDVVTVDTSNFVVDQRYNFTVNGDDGYFRINDLQFDATEVKDNYTSDQKIKGNISTVRGESPATAQLLDSDNDTIANKTLTLKGNNNVTAEFAEQTIADSPYKIIFTDNQTTQTSNITDIPVEKNRTGKARLGSDVYLEQQGDVANMTINMRYTTNATLQIGVEKSDHYNLTAQVTDKDNDGEVNIGFNTFTAGASQARQPGHDGSPGTGSLDPGTGNAGPATVLYDSTGDDSVTTLDENGIVNFDENRPNDATAVGREILEPGRYKMTVTSGHKSQVEDQQDIAAFEISERSVGAVQLHRAPESSFSSLNEGEEAGVSDVTNLLGNGTASSGEGKVTTFNDTAIVEIEASGIEGPLRYVKHNDVGVDKFEDVDDIQNNTLAYAILNNLGDTTSNPAGGLSAPSSPDSGSLQGNGAGPNSQTVINLSLINAGPHPNSRPSIEEYERLTNENRSVLHDGKNDTHYVIIDTDHFFKSNSGGGTRGLTANGNFKDGSRLKANFTVASGESDLADSPHSGNSTTTLKHRTATLNRGHDVRVKAEGGQEISGTTNLPPQSEITVQVNSNIDSAVFFERPTASVSENGTFTATFNLSNKPPNSNFTARASINGMNISEQIDGRVVRPGVEITEAPTNTPTPEPVQTIELPPQTATQTTAPENPTETEQKTSATPTQQGNSTTATQTTVETTTGGGGPGFTLLGGIFTIISAIMFIQRRKQK